MATGLFPYQVHCHGFICMTYENIYIYIYTEGVEFVQFWWNVLSFLICCFLFVLRFGFYGLPMAEGLLL